MSSRLSRCFTRVARTGGRIGWCVAAGAWLSLIGLSVDAGVFDQPSPSNPRHWVTGSTPSGFDWLYVTTGSALPVTGTSVSAGSPGAVVYFNTDTGQIQVDPKGLHLSTLIITYGTGNANISGTTRGPFVYPSGTTTNAISPTTGTPKTFPAVTAVTGLPPTTFAARVGMTIGAPLGPSLATSGSPGNIASTAGFWDQPWAFPIEMVASGSAAVMTLTNFYTVGQTLNPNINRLGFGTGRATFQYSANGIVGNQVGAVIPVSRFPFTIVTIESGTQTQSQAGYELFAGDLAVEKQGVGTLVLTEANTLAANINVRQGVVQLNSPLALASGTLVPFGGGAVKVASRIHATIGGLTPTAGGLVDVGTGRMTVSSGLAVTGSTGLMAALVQGRSGGTWTGTAGIVSSAAAADINAGEHFRTVGWVENPNGSLTFGYAASGDTNLDGAIDILDASRLLQNTGFGTGAAATWQTGDFNYDGLFDILDVIAFTSTNLYDAGAYDSPLPMSVVSVPEPASLGLVAMLSYGSCLWRRRRSVRNQYRRNSSGD